MVQTSAGPGYGLEEPTRGALAAIMRCIVPSMFVAQQPWAVIGSVASVMQGLPDYRPPDIDLASTAEGAEIMQRCIAGAGETVRPVSYSVSGPYASHFGIFEVDGIKVEVMGDLVIERPDGIIDLTDHWSRWSEKVRICELDGRHIPVVPLEWQLVANVLLGRGARSRGIADFLLQHGYDLPFLESVLYDPLLGRPVVASVRRLLLLDQ
jgi:hypothetical protein